FHADHREHDAGEAAEEQGGVEGAGDRVSPRGAEQVRQQTRVEEEAVTDERDDAREAPPGARSGRGRGQRWNHWRSERVLRGSCASSSTNCATRGSCHARWKLAHTCESGSRRKSPHTKGSALMSLTSPLGSTMKSAAGSCRR